jgi:hypothetical protein
VTSHEGKREPLPVAGMMLRLCQSSFVFTKHETAHEYGTKHDDETEKV